MLGKQQTEKISRKTNLYSYLLHSMGWSHTIALQPQGGFLQPSCTCTHGRSVSLRHPRLQPAIFCYIMPTFFDTEPTALDFTCPRASESQTGDYQPFLPAFYNFWVLLSAKIPMLVLPGPVIIFTTCFRLFILSVQS